MVKQSAIDRKNSTVLNARRGLSVAQLLGWICPRFNRTVRNCDSGMRRVALLLLIPCFALIQPRADESSTGRDWIRIIPKPTAGKIEFYIENRIAADVTVTLTIDSDNLTSDVAWPYTESFAAGKTTKAFTLRQTDASKPWKWSYKYSCTWGNLHAKVDTDHIYQLPYAPGASFPISQGFNGRFSHSGTDCYSVDWQMPIGTPVYAARGGVVVAAKDDSTRGGPDKKFDWDANYLLIKHSDGSYGHYAHLLANGNQVSVGDTVRAGQSIALSGNTGFSTGPHLHFDVFTGLTGEHRQTIPTRFQTAAGLALNLNNGDRYQALATAQGGTSSGAVGIVLTPNRP